VSADGWFAFQRLVLRYGDPQRLERDLVELAELRRRVAELSGASEETRPTTRCTGWAGACSGGWALSPSFSSYG
jgi:hypothetical protein